MQLSEDTKKMLEKATGLSIEQMSNMSEDEIRAYAQQKNGKKAEYKKYSKQSSGDDGVLLDMGKTKTLEQTEEEIQQFGR